MRTDPRKNTCQPLCALVKVLKYSLEINYIESDALDKIYFKNNNGPNYCPGVHRYPEDEAENLLLGTRLAAVYQLDNLLFVIRAIECDEKFTIEWTRNNMSYVQAKNTRVHQNNMSYVQAKNTRVEPEQHELRPS